MSRVYTIEATLNLDGDEQDYPVRAHVAYESQRGGGWGGSVDGDVEAFVFDAWVSLDRYAS